MTLLFAILLVTGFASAEQPILAQELNCRINFNMGVLNSFQNFSNSSPDIHQSITTLQNDLSRIKSFNNNLEVQNFSKGQYSEDMQRVLSSTQSFRKGGRISPDQKAALDSSYKQLQTNYAQCEQQVYTEIGQQKLQQYQNQIADFQNKTNDLKSRGFDVTSLNQLLSNAQTQIVQPLQTALASANSTQAVMTAVKTYCLYDDCLNGTNFHLDANFDITRLTIILNDLQTNADAFNLSNSTLSQAQQNLSNAQAVLTSIGTSTYQEGQIPTVFNNIQAASKIIMQSIIQVMKQPIGGLKK